MGVVLRLGLPRAGVRCNDLPARGSEALGWRGHPPPGRRFVRTALPLSGSARDPSSVGRLPSGIFSLSAGSLGGGLGGFFLRPRARSSAVLFAPAVVAPIPNGIDAFTPVRRCRGDAVVVIFLFGRLPITIFAPRAARSIYFTSAYLRYFKIPKISSLSSSTLLVPFFGILSHKVA